MDRGRGGNDQPPQQPGDNTEQPPQQPEDGQMPENGNSQTFDITDATVITDQDGKEIALADLSEKAFVTFTADGDTLLTISITEAKGMRDGKNSTEGENPDEK